MPDDRIDDPPTTAEPTEALEAAKREPAEVVDMLEFLRAKVARERERSDA